MSMTMSTRNRARYGHGHGPGGPGCSCCDDRDKAPIRRRVRRVERRAWRAEALAARYGN